MGNARLLESPKGVFTDNNTSCVCTKFRHIQFFSICYTAY